jgi:hypothetical protein
MKALRTILILLGLVVLSFAPVLIVDHYKARKAAEEVERMTTVKLVVTQKLEAYYRAKGQYPDSLDVLSFTNSPQEIQMQPELKKIWYRHTSSNYDIGWDGQYGWGG